MADSGKVSFANSTFRLGNQLSKSSKQGNLDGSSMLIVTLEYIGDWYMRTLIDEDVNFKDITHSWLAVVCVWL